MEDDEHMRVVITMPEEEEEEVEVEVEIEEEVEEKEEGSDREEVSQEDWDKLFLKGNFKKEDMDMLVMDFLISRELSYVAAAFHTESGCPLGIEDLSLVRTQSAIRRLFFYRQYDDAIDLINRDFGSGFLTDQPRLLFYIEQQKMIEMCRARNFGGALEYSHEFVKWCTNEDADIEVACRQTLLLMMYGDDRESPVGYLLEFPRLFYLATEVIKNIVIFQGRETDNLIERGMRMLKATQQELSEEVKFPYFNVRSGFPEPLPHLNIETL